LRCSSSFVLMNTKVVFLFIFLPTNRVIVDKKRPNSWRDRSIR